MSTKIVIFGAGHYGRAILRKCNKSKKFKIICFFDSNKNKNKKVILGKKIYYIDKINQVIFKKIIQCGRNIDKKTKQLKKYDIDKKKL